MAKYINVSNHIEDLDSGLTLAPGENVDLDDEDIKQPIASRLLDEGKLIGTGNVSSEEAESRRTRAQKKAKKEEEQALEERQEEIIEESKEGGEA
jgi:hypothetical protein